ncbi:hypothetical protein [Plantactinospora soyae]|uniref:Uncharacterized protein n=1 Tax=Plantactinospora soyae TaxID=1544732 RepID=A0A927M1Q3_9ACTN|nr:hypothetical protein [Plantactinospora soyae]MBE1486543.1 hypothetical protein [Plantactinospora soyae]
MRLTVGPLPPAVYWRRRAVVLGAGLLFLIVLLYSCFGPGDKDNTGKGAGSGQSTEPTPLLTPEVDPSQSGTPESGAPVEPASSGDPTGEPDGGGDEAPVAPVGGGQVPTAPPPVQNECTDAEMSVIPVPSQTSAQRGEPVSLRIKIKNLSGRTCNRDVGADLQELYLKLGARKVWSSDGCSTVRANDVRPFPPSHESTYTIDWNGRESSKCDNGLAAGNYPPAGTYQLFGRLGDKLSEPVRLTITG